MANLSFDVGLQDMQTVCQPYCVLCVHQKTGNKLGLLTWTEQHFYLFKDDTCEYPSATIL